MELSDKALTPIIEPVPMRWKVIVPVATTILAVVIVLSLFIVARGPDRFDGFQRVTYQYSTGPFIMDGLHVVKCVSVVYKNGNSTLSGYMLVFGNQTAAGEFARQYVSLINDTNVKEIMVGGENVTLFSFNEGKGYTLIAEQRGTFIAVSSYDVSLPTLKSFYFFFLSTYDPQ